MVSGVSKTALAVALLQTAGAQAQNCTSTFTPVPASSYIASLNPGWNLGNTLDAIETEGSWNNPPVVPSTFDAIKASGFKGIRLPITWAYHFTSSSPDWTVDSKWLQRVEDVVDMVTARGMPVLLNVHHDSWEWADISQPNANLTMIEEKFYKLWHQIGTKLACKSSLVAFEPINEIPGATAAHGAETNKLNNLFLQAINDAGGHNAKRVVTLVGVGEDGVKTSQWFEKPENLKFGNPWALQYHYYSPYDFIFSAWGKTTWGSGADKAALEADIAAVRGNFTDVPLVIGEWDASVTNTEPAARWKYFDFFIRTAAKYNTSTILWDNGLDHFDRAANQWRDPTVLSILTHAVKGSANSLPDSSTGSESTQWTSAYASHKLNTPVEPISLPYLFNGNTLTSITTSSSSSDANTTLTSPADYTVAASNITLTRSFLSKYFTSNTTGALANLTLHFSAGSSTSLTLLQFTTPTLTRTSSALPATSSDLYIPIRWAGLSKPAAVRALKADGTILIDDWTQYLGPLQQGRMTYSSQWDWDSSNIILKAGVLDAVRAAGVDTTFTVEFFPRVMGNSVNYTITV